VPADGDSRPARSAGPTRRGRRTRRSLAADHPSTDWLGPSAATARRPSPPRTRLDHRRAGRCTPSAAL